ncbi:MAG: DUF664 domain-containing protein [Chloroflexi bacterium]|nr:MAG: DUF664 domain-containing protein [Chloroflexota bacterium]
MSQELESFRLRFEYEFDRLLETIHGLDDEAVNWKPPAPGTNSLLVLVTHALGSAEDHVVGKAAKKEIVRDRDAEFAAKGSAARLESRAAEVRARIADALAGLDGRLDEEREPPMRTWPAQGTVRDRLVHSIAHTAEHVGHAQLTRDLWRARGAKAS